MSAPATQDSLKILLKSLRLPTFLSMYEEIAIRGEREGWSFAEYLHQLALLERHDREQRKIERLLKQSGLPREKTLETLEKEKLPVQIQRMLPSLCEGHFVKQAENILAFGMPGVGKTHVLCAIGNALVRRGIPVLFIPAHRLVQRLLKAKQELMLEKELKKLERYEAVIIDDIGYVQQDREEMEVLFTFLAERYERKSVLLSSNLVFSQWDRIFKDAMTTAAAIDRLVHHCVILELTGPSYRTKEAKKKQESSTTPEEQNREPHSLNAQV